MAFTITSHAQANSTTAGATLAIGSVTASPGHWLVLAVASDNAGASGVSSVTGVTDSAGNAWVLRSSTNRTPGGVVDDGTTLSIFTCAVSVALAAGTVTVAFSPNTTSKCGIIKRVVPGSGEGISFRSAGAGFTGAGTSFTSGAFAVTSGEYVFAYDSSEQSSAVTDDADTTDGAWSTGQTTAANTGTQSTSQLVHGQHKLATGTGNQSFDPTTAVSRDWALNYIILFNSGMVGASAGVASVSGVGWTSAEEESAMALALREAYALAPADEVILNTLEIRHPSFIDADGNPDSAWIVADNCDFEGTIEYEAPVRGGETITFTKLAFSFRLPNIEPGAAAEIEISIDNVSRELTEQFDRAVEDPTPITIVYRPFLSSDPSHPQMDPPPRFELSEVHITVMRVTARARSTVDLRGAFPRRVYTASEFPGLINR